MSLQSLLCERISVARDLIKRAEGLSKSQKRRIEGGAKLCSKLKAELNFLHKVEAGKVAVKECHLQSTNLTHLQAIIESAESLEDVVSVLHVFAYEDRFGDKQTLVVDVVANGGHTWVKAIGRKAEALHNIWLGRGQYGDKSVIEQAEDFLQASHQQPVEYSNPHIIFAFYNSVSSPMAERLKEMGISVRGDVVAVNSLVEPSAENEHPSESDEEGPEPLQVTRVDRENLVASIAFPTQIKVNVCNRVNLDITTLITYVSALSYGGCYFVFKEKVLTEQAAQERRERVLPQLEEFMEGKDLFACESAVRDFQSILETLGGAGEKERAALLVKRINVVPDQPSERALGLATSSKINSRSLTIFGTGDTLKAITMTANSGFVRAAANQGVRFSVFVHQPRALTESKESAATPLPKSCPSDSGL
ncbi:CG025 protein, partial [Scytalopus superciliaris]|nr:CG025 protein [Scytalopus superciliaris]